MNKYVIFHIDGGCGKNIVATSVVKSIKSAYPDGLKGEDIPWTARQTIIIATIITLLLSLTGSKPIKSVEKSIIIVARIKASLRP